MRIYLAARYSRREELCRYRSQLESLGHFVTSRWLDGEHQIDREGRPIGDNGEKLVEEGGDRAAALRDKFAQDDFADVLKCDLLIHFTEKPREPSTNRGGRHVETGIALGLMKRVWVVGYRENIFHWLEDVRFFESWLGAFDQIACETRREHTANSPGNPVANAVKESGM